MSLSLSRIQLLQRPSIQQAIVATQAANAESTANAQAGRVDSIETRALQQLDGFWQVLAGFSLVFRWDSISGSGTTKRMRVYRYVKPLSTIYNVPGYEIGGSAWNTWHLVGPVGAVAPVAVISNK